MRSVPRRCVRVAARTALLQAATAAGRRCGAPSAGGSRASPLQAGRSMRPSTGAGMLLRMVPRIPRPASSGPPSKRPPGPAGPATSKSSAWPPWWRCPSGASACPPLPMLSIPACGLLLCCTCLTCSQMKLQPRASCGVRMYGQRGRAGCRRKRACYGEAGRELGNWQGAQSCCVANPLATAQQPMAGLEGAWQGRNVDGGAWLQPRLHAEHDAV